MDTTQAAAPIPLRDRLIYALDGMSLDEALAAVRQLRSVVGLYKIGPSLVYQGGLEVARQVVQAGAPEPVRVFLDMKTWDIPETVMNTLGAIARYGGEAVVFATIHTFSLNFRRLLEARRSGQLRVKIFAVTLLTSQDEGDLREMGIRLGVEDYVLYMARRARDFGCDGVICSGHEVGRIKRELGKGFLAITPGIRPASGAVVGDDQKRIVTPRQAILDGADHLVVGRPIRMAPDPQAAARAIQQEIAAALAEANA